ncbi:MAG: hypothetical protein HKN82_08120 [Akkermansiaceae bacterium]|nr:hypothetical protein [Akkermansiaceae bacterium]NNM31074.1 hypothetical protein [Akkermansiaceae bacterium]
MRKIVLILLILAAPLARAVPATATLELVDDPSGNFNSFDVTLRITVLFFTYQDTSTTGLSGTTEVRFDIDPATDTASEMTFVGGDLAGDPVAFELTVASLSSGPLGGTVFTTTPPGPVDPSTGTFDSTLHQFLINEGSLTGTAGGSPVNVDFAASPAGGRGNGPGIVNLARTGTTATTAEYDVEFELPINTNEITNVNGTDVTIITAGRIKGAGSVSVPLNEYIAWTIENGIPGAPFAGDEDGDGIANGLLWGLGLAAAANPAAHLPAVALAGGTPLATIDLPPGGTGAPLLVERANDPAGPWTLAPTDATSLGSNPLPAGAAGPVTVSFPAAPAGYTRLRVEAP